MSTINTSVFCTLQFEGIHNWPTCPIDEVSYLRVPHRHIFHVKATVPVYHDDRDVEFIYLKHRIQEFLDEWLPRAPHVKSIAVYDMKAMSCEMIARKLVEEFNLTECVVSEDGENGAIITVSN